MSYLPNINHENVIYVAKNGSDTNDGSFGNPFLTIGAANDYAITQLNPVIDWDECIVIRVRPGVYTENLTNSHARIIIISDTFDMEHFDESAVIYNTGADEAHYPINTDQYLNLIGMTVKTDMYGVYGKMIDMLICNSCYFYFGEFIENPTRIVNQYWNQCQLGGGYGFNLTGTANFKRHLAFRRCNLQCKKPVNFGSTGSGIKDIKLERSQLDMDLTIAGSWSFNSMWTELYSNGELTFNTTGYIDIFATLITNGIHFINDTAEYKRIVSCDFRGIESTYDVTADTTISGVEFSNNNSEKGLCSNIQITNTTRSVAKSNGDYTTLSGALASITGNDSDHRFEIRLAPGIYEEDNPIQTKEYVSIISTGGVAVTKVIAKNPDQDIFLAAENALIENITIGNAYTGAGISCTLSGVTCYKDIIFADCKQGIKTNHTDAIINVYNIKFKTTNGYSFDDGILIENGSMDIRDLCVFKDTEITSLIKSTGTNSTVDIWNLQTESTNVTNGLYATSGGKIYIATSDINNTTNAFRIEQDSYICARTCLVGNSKTHDLWITGNGEYGGHASALNRDKVYDENNQAIIHSFGCDPGRKTFRSMADYSVGMPFRGHNTYLGEGGPYQDGVLAMTFDGNSTYTDVTSISGIAFPNTVTGTCIYFGELNKHYWYGLQYLQGDTVISGGSIEWQYYDGGSGWTKMNSLNTIDSYSNSYNSNSFIGENGTTQSIRFDADIKTGVIESDSGATGWEDTTINSNEAKWVRCMITSNIDQSPKFQLIRFKGNYTHIRENGTHCYNGEARNLKCDMVIFGDNSGTGANKALDISPNITYPYWSNSLATTSQRLYFRFLINETVDTSCGLNVKYTISTPYTDTNDASCTLNVHTAAIKEDDAFVNTNPEVLQVETFNYIANEVANKVHVKTLSNRIDISDLKTNDVVYVCFRRMTGATMTGSLDMSNVCFLYRCWQNGENLLV